ncbi:hypothetical protein TIFTF001_050032 [Ficus carica]|uniref:Uncharacterized protein n=1 Tax=Ficus carica TaxID=3494 RepID=A0AA87YS18_FICCA|nr:hypothetical protein TIFTF001_050032 [Ficus carica]
MVALPHGWSTKSFTVRLNPMVEKTA